ncbi:MAG TPA: NADH-dependent [FeFe] hydrogenase, group A6 [Spirochaetia bacterium]|nr:NADH-dependent [FeFe] hydrogenase, group A6 [Spirochaetia bacterium]
MSGETVSLFVDGRKTVVPAGTGLVEACAAAGARVPTLCYLEGVSANASCGVCVVEVEGAKSLVRACTAKAAEGMKVRTASERVMRARRTVVELLLANHPADCLVCSRNGACELQALAEDLGPRKLRFQATKRAHAPDLSSAGLARDDSKCILCGRCVAVCQEVQTVSAIQFAGRGIRTRVSAFMDRGLAGSPCVQCGQCSVVCPTGAIAERDETEAVERAVAKEGLVVAVQTAPAIRASLGEALGMEPGSLVTGKMVAALRRLGFDKVFDTQFTADLTIMEEGSELIERLTKGGVLPMITSCSPGWINFIEAFFPALLPHLSSCKSPQQMFGAVAKTFFAEKAGIAPESLRVASIMPCTAKKGETRRPGMDAAWRWWRGKGRELSAFPDVDWALTTRELARMIRRAGIDMASLPEEDFDDPLGRSTGAATIFGTTGGVMEAALRTVHELVNGAPLPGLAFAPARGLEGIKEASLVLGGKELKVAVAHGLKNARALLEGIAAGTSPYAFIEVMTCPGGCVGGGGQPHAFAASRGATARGPVAQGVAAKGLSARNLAMYREDERLGLRKSHENPAVAALYADFLGKPLGHLSHELLHTEYARREF